MLCHLERRATTFSLAGLPRLTRVRKYVFHGGLQCHWLDYRGRACLCHLSESIAGGDSWQRVALAERKKEIEVVNGVKPRDLDD